MSLSRQTSQLLRHHKSLTITLKSKCLYSSYSTTTDSPRPSPPQSSLPEPEIFSGPSRPRSRYSSRATNRTFATYTELPKSQDEAAKEAKEQAETKGGEKPEVEVFAEASKPREYYTRPMQRDLPPLVKTWPIILGLSVLGVGLWGAFYAYATNQERLSSSVVKQIMNTIKDNEELEQVLGDAIRFEPTWWLNGDPWINGSNHMLQGNVDLSFRVKGHKGAGTLYFTSIRKAKGEPFTILRFKVIGDNGQVVNVPVHVLG